MKKLLFAALIGCVAAGGPTTRPAATTKPAQVAQAGAPVAADPVRVFRDLRYGDGPGRSNLLDLYLPAGESASSTRHPLLIWVHGGAWIGGDKGRCPIADAVRDGFVVASINYRLSTQAFFPAQIHDCKGAVRWLRAHADEYGIDPQRIGAFGASAGGHLVALLGTSAGDEALEGTVGGNLDQSSRVQAVCDWFGPTDMSRLREELGNDSPFVQHPEFSPVAGLFGGMARATPQRVQQANPIAFVDKTDPPFLIMHGDHDKLVPLAQSQLLADALKTAGVPVDFRIVKNAGHGQGFGPQREAVRQFFLAQLKK